MSIPHTPHIHPIPHTYPIIHTHFIPHSWITWAIHHIEKTRNAQNEWMASQSTTSPASPSAKQQKLQHGGVSFGSSLTGL
ncbi:hypothetical protein I307_02718 [Cryptococcus deuterogattii 99/473]|uniref:Uncharacterized protein n=1 Tax=Cryptococcus deuterogattii Ram5 TaxID=1296110 RepID=A0A0D0UWP0_9TREE|nr:hypothetical protein I309_06045 [Cryptococcus deuterogattii LA55]KIR32502.1 hypothetical protein I352_04927 [Cryptococcus deuterogattii MMRL2647]KIR39671.1 hypothetical protein I313_04142 [Cryptococcus deuterogattii Ram5]KIR70780.1 hypothetical protein I310_05631 [Cryptococcus deuterogattii CA1014]KIR90641.1 hypothetical protein I304_05290 [Cryptococcus deuterogattii CBS 10090]KIR97619.1 hypothetical protein L804_05306 [Cryptococcus deuterogattii 2001/935-1]KIY58042.1 hypothetical protein 